MDKDSSVRNLQQCICLIDVLIYILCKFKVQLKEGELTVFQEQSDVFTKLEEDIEDLEEQVNKLLM